jgi:hypothetical protein
MRALDAPALGLVSATKALRQSLITPPATQQPTQSTSPAPETKVSLRESRIYDSLSVFDIALVMQLRPGVGPDPAWLVRYLMAMFGWLVVLMAGRNEMRPTHSQL